MLAAGVKASGVANWHRNASTGRGQQSWNGQICDGSVKQAFRCPLCSGLQLESFVTERYYKWLIFLKVNLKKKVLGLKGYQ